MITTLLLLRRSIRGKIPGLSMHKGRAWAPVWLLALPVALAVGGQPAAGQLVYGQLVSVAAPDASTAPGLGENPVAGLAQGADGMLYGVMSTGGSSSSGTIFRLNRDGSGYGYGYSVNPISLGAGSDPEAAFFPASDGMLYGTTASGGSSGWGMVFKLNPAGAGTTTPVRSFNGGANDGAAPYGALVQGNDGSLYGTTSGDGATVGTIFRINTDGSSYTNIHFFSSANDGRSPHAGLIQGADGMLYGAARQGGTAGDGTLFKLNTDGTGYSNIYNFTGMNGDGANPFGQLVQASDGRLYGTTFKGGSNGAGMVFGINTNGSGYQKLYSFMTNGSDAANAYAGLVEWSDGLLYGTTYNGGASNNGAVFRIGKDGTHYSVLKSFTGSGGDGANPHAGLMAGTDGSLYGTTYTGGSAGYGTIYTLGTPPANDDFTNRIALVGPAAVGNGYNLNATAESGEPVHGGGGSLTNSVWWAWSGLAPGLVTMLTDGSINAIIDVYTGTNLNSLTLVASSATMPYPGSSNRVTFTAAAGSNYAVAITGLLAPAPGPSTTNSTLSDPPVFAGSGPINLSLRALDLEVLAVTNSVDAQSNTLFTAKVEVGNAQPFVSGPLRVQVLAHAGAGVVAENIGSVQLPADQVLGNYPLTNAQTLAPNTSTTLIISNVCPAPITNVEGVVGYGWGAFVLLQQQVGTNWFTMDQDLVLYGVWPTVSGFSGPGGGVIRLNPVSSGAPPLLLQVTNSGPGVVTGGNAAQYIGIANFTEGVVINFSNTAWTASSFSITTNGLFQTRPVATNTMVTIDCPYYYNSATNTSSFQVVVVPAPTLSTKGHGLLPDHEFQLALNGTYGASYIVEATTNLNQPTVWTPLSTNGPGTNGIWVFTDSQAAGFRQRYYRAQPVQ
jgi:uncharacterized repeat protein (TIGR03803 family)